MSKTKLQYELDLQRSEFTKQMKGAIAQVTELDKKLDALNKKKLGGSESGGGFLKKAAFGAAIAYATSKFVDFERAVVGAYAKYESFNASLRTLLQGNTGMAKALNDQLIQVAKTTPFSLQEVQDSTKQLLAYGFQAGDISKNINRLGDVASGIGAPMGDIVYLYGTLRTQGRAFAKDIYQFTGRGIPIVRELAKQFHVTDDKVMQLVTDGKVGFKEIEKAFIAMTSKGGQFFGMMDEQSRTLGGKLSNLGDSWDQLMVSIGKSQHGILNSLVELSTKSINAMQQQIEMLNRVDAAYDRAKLGPETGNNRATWYASNLAKVATGAAFGGLGGMFIPKTALEKRLDFAEGVKSKYTDPAAMNSEDSPLFKSRQMQYDVAYAEGRITQAQREKFSAHLVSAARQDDVSRGQLSAAGIMRDQAALHKEKSDAAQRHELTSDRSDNIDRRLAILADALESVKGNIDLAKTRGMDSTGPAGPPPGAETTAKGLEQGFVRPQNIYISIDRLTGIEKIDKFVVENETVKGETLKDIRDIIARTMLEAVNDANNMMK